MYHTHKLVMQVSVMLVTVWLLDPRGVIVEFVEETRESRLKNEINQAEKGVRDDPILVLSAEQLGGNGMIVVEMKSISRVQKDLKVLLK